MKDSKGRSWCWTKKFGLRKLPTGCIINRMALDFDIGFIPETPEEKEESVKQEIANSTDATPGMAEAITGHTWQQIYRMLRYI